MNAYAIDDLQGCLAGLSTGSSGCRTTSGSSSSARAASAGYAAAREAMQEMLDAPDRRTLLYWLRGVPLAQHEQGVLFVHAGVLPDWDVAKTRRRQAGSWARLTGNAASARQMNMRLPGIQATQTKP